MRHTMLPLLIAFAATSLRANASEPPIHEPNAFIGSFRMEIHLFKNGKEEEHSPLNMRYWSTSDKLLYEMVLPGEQQRMRMLTDLRDNHAYTLVDQGDGGRVAMRMKRPGIPVKEESTSEKPKITMTRETRVIEGQTCTKVIAESEEGIWTGWVAMGLKSAFFDMARGMDEQSAQKFKHVGSGITGFPLEYEWVPTTGDERVICTVKDLKPGPVDEKLFDLSGYQVMDMPSFGIPQR
ncbi:MAG: DUF4412 domain-containing protein [Bacteroidetes bacterium]|nr:DUF4412 domain-containing protein [Bacteroidota bacterium]HMU12854.1 DUF4412 domain-containing protein [Flavobacteriales bacterium]